FLYQQYSGLSHGQELRGAGHHSFHRRNPFLRCQRFHQTRVCDQTHWRRREAGVPELCGAGVAEDKCALMDNYRIGDEIKVTFNLSGRLWAKPGNPEKCFTSLQAWRIEGAGSGGADEFSQTMPNYDAPAYDDDVPF